jgi:hypothetical protein
MQWIQRGCPHSIHFGQDQDLTGARSWRPNRHSPPSQPVPEMTQRCFIRVPFLGPGAVEFQEIPEWRFPRPYCTARQRRGSSSFIIKLQQQSSSYTIEYICFMMRLHFKARYTFKLSVPSCSTCPSVRGPTFSASLQNATLQKRDFKSSISKGNLETMENKYCTLVSLFVRAVCGLRCGCQAKARMKPPITRRSPLSQHRLDRISIVHSQKDVVEVGWVQIVHRHVDDETSKGKRCRQKARKRKTRPIRKDSKKD